MKIAVVGTGYVGLVTEPVLQKLVLTLYVLTLTKEKLTI